MTIKYKIDDLEGIDEQYRDLYKKTDDGKYRLDVEGVDDVGALKRAKEREKERAQAAAAEAESLRAEIAEIKKKIKDGEYSAAKGKGDIDALEKSWQEKLQAREDELTNSLTQMKTALEQQMIMSAVDQVADIFVAPKTQREYIKSRLSVEIVDGKPVTRVLDDDGKPTAMTVAEFKESLKNDPDLAQVIVGSQASGAGASGGSGGASSGAIDLTKATRAERVAYYKRKRQTA